MKQRGDLSTLEAVGLRWHTNGQASLSGAVLDLAGRIDRSFVALAEAWGAHEQQFPVLISASELDKLDYFRSFPHLISFPVSLDPDDANLERFTQGRVVNERGEVELAETAPVREVLTPAACYHIYIHEQGRSLPGPRYYTTRNSCFRRERYYEPLRRQWGFSMREIVCAGTIDEVRAFLGGCRHHVEGLLRAVGLPVDWATATDPFFQPLKNGKYIAQRINPTKTEAVYGGDLAIASVNLHQDHFGRAFAIERDGAPAFTGCVAFGLERWLWAVIAEHGDQPARWPDFPLHFNRPAPMTTSVAAAEAE
jgi:seryl-tRNA synthetase